MFACPRQPRHYRADGQIQYGGNICVSHLFHGHEQQDLALIRGQLRQRPVEVAHFHPALLHGRTQRFDAIVRSIEFSSSAAVDVDVVHDGKQPRAKIRAGAPQMAARPRALERILHQIVGMHGATAENARVAPQPRDLLDKEYFEFVHARLFAQ